MYESQTVNEYALAPASTRRGLMGSVVGHGEHRKTEELCRQSLMFAHPKGK